MNLGRAIRQLREMKELTQQELADLVGVTDAYITMLERGKRKNPSLATLKRIARALGVPVEELLERRPTMTRDEAVLEAGIAKGKYWSFQDIYTDVEALMGESWGKIAHPEAAVRASVYGFRKQELIEGKDDTYTVTDDGKWWREWKRHEPEFRRLWKGLTPARQQEIMETLLGRKKGR